MTVPSLLERILADAEHHEACANLSKIDEGTISHSSMAAAFRIAAEYIRREGDQQRAAYQYREQVSAPLGELTVAALNERLASGDVPRRRVRRQEPAVEPLLPRAERCPEPECTDEQQCWRCDYEESQHASAVAQAAGYCPHCGRGDAGPSPDEYGQTRRRAARFQARIDAARVWARQHLDAEQQAGLLGVLRGDQPKEPRP